MTQRSEHHGSPFVLAAWLAIALACAGAPLEAGATAAPGDADAQGSAAASDGSADPHDPTTPAGAIRAFVDAARDADYAGAAERLDLSGVSEAERAERGPQLARWLKIVLDRKLWIQYELMSTDPAGDLDDGLAPDLERVRGDGDLLVLLERVGRDGRREWVVSSGTVARIPQLYERFGYGPLGEWLPLALFEVRFLEVQLWQWIGLVLLVLLAWIGGWIAARVVAAVARPFVARTETDLDDHILELLRAPLQYGMTLAAFAVGATALRLSVPVHEFLRDLERGLAVVVLSWALLRLIDIAAALVSERLERDPHSTAKAIVPLARRSVKVCLVALAAVFLLQNLGFQVAGLLAGLGVGGLAVALAAQKTLANLFGGIALILDRPVGVGDFCRFGDGKLGVVEDVGLRSTRVRTLDRTVVTVPNSEFSEIQLENFARRDRIRLAMTLGLRYETTPDQLRFVLRGLRELLLAHPRVSHDPARVRFIGFGAHSLDLEVFAYVETADFNEFCAVREDILLRIMDVVHDAGAGFAFPSQTLYLGRDGGYDEAQVRAAEEAVEDWRSGGRLPFPDPSPDQIAAVDDTIDYPPRGSVSAPEGGGSGG